MKWKIGTGAAITLVVLAACFNPVGGNSPPPQITNVQLTVQGLSEISVSWTEVTEDETPAAEIVYEIHWSTASGESTESFTADAVVVGAGTYTIENVPGYTPIYVAIRATDGAPETGPASEEVTATTTATLSFVEPGANAEIDAPQSSIYRADNLTGVSLGTDLYVTWYDNSISEFQAAVQSDSSSAFVVIDDGGFSNSVSASGGSGLFQTSVYLGVATVDLYDPGPPESWSDVTGDIPSGNTDEYVQLGEIDGVTNAVAISNDVANQSAVLREWNGSNWDAVGGQIFSAAPGTWAAAQPAVRAASDVFVMGSAGSGDPEVYSYDGSTWTNVTDTEWASSTDGSIVASGDSVFAVIVSGTGIPGIWQYSGSGSEWTHVVSDIRYDAGQTAVEAAITQLNGTLFVGWIETSASQNRAHLGVYSAAAATPAWEIIDGGGAGGLNSTPTTYNATKPDLLVHQGSVIFLFTEDSGVSGEYIEGYRID